MSLSRIISIEHVRTTQINQDKRARGENNIQRWQLIVHGHDDTVNWQEKHRGHLKHTRYNQKQFHDAAPWKIIFLIVKMTVLFRPV